MDLINKVPTGTLTLISPNLRHFYEVHYKRYTISTLLLFTQTMPLKERIVIKILRGYKDNRYHLGKLYERQKCQVEALQWNRKFAPGVYIGLASIDIANHKIGEIIPNPLNPIELEEDAEYGLIMYELPANRRLDILLEEDDEDSRSQHIELLAHYIAYMHTYLVKPLDFSKENQPWARFDQIYRKLEHNFDLISKNLHIYPNLKDLFNRLKKNIYQVLKPSTYQDFFEQRIREQRIMRCHGDLKAPHIWIMPYNYLSFDEPWEYVRILDAIDFNQMYCHIDILSDLAMLVIDIEARSKKPKLADKLIDTYLKLTGQNDDVSKAVLKYYLVEKAVMWAGVSLIYDQVPNLSLAFLKVAEKRMSDLEWKEQISDAETLLTIPNVTPISFFYSK